MSADTSQAFLGNSARPHSIEHAGRTYRVRRLDQTGMEAFSAWLIEWTRRQLVRVYGHDRETLRAKLAELERDALDGVYEFTEEAVLGREVWREQSRAVGGQEVRGLARDVDGGALHTHRGRVAMLAILCECSQDEALALILHRPDEVGHLLQLVLAESLPAAKEKDSWRPLPGEEGPEGNAPQGGAAGREVPAA
jgi:hypothetical protein